MGGRAIAVVGVLAFFVGACGSGDDETPESVVTDAVETSDAPVGPTRTEGPTTEPPRTEGTEGDGVPAAADEFFLEPISSGGENPFFAAVDTDEPDVVPPPAPDRTVPGDTAGLYGGTRNQTTCEPDQLVDFLETNDVEAATWAEVRGTPVAEIADYVDGLTALLLRADTAVVNNGFADGSAVPFPAVLQAGTAVLVDSDGSPVVKCFSGNPLTAPPSTDGATFEGPAWDGFDSAAVIAVQPAPADIDIFVVTDIDSDEPFGRPAGTNGDADGPVADDATTTTADGTSTGPDVGGTGDAATGSQELDASYEGELDLDCGDGPTTLAITATLGTDGSLFVIVPLAVGPVDDRVLRDAVADRAFPQGGIGAGDVADDGSFTLVGFGSLDTDVMTGTLDAGEYGAAVPSAVHPCAGSVSATRTD